MTDEVLLSSIYTHISNIADVPDVFYPNVNYETLPDEYLEVHVMPSVPDDIGLRQVTHISGIIQINVVTKSNAGSLVASRIADKVMTAFARNTVIATSLIRIDKTPYTSHGFNTEEGKYKVPITIVYNSVEA